MYPTPGIATFRGVYGDATLIFPSYGKCRSRPFILLLPPTCVPVTKLQQFFTAEGYVVLPGAGAELHHGPKQSPALMCWQALMRSGFAVTQSREQEGYDARMGSTAVVVCSAPCTCYQCAEHAGLSW